MVAGTESGRPNTNILCQYTAYDPCFIFLRVIPFGVQPTTEDLFVPTKGILRVGLLVVPRGSFPVEAPGILNVLNVAVPLRFTAIRVP